MCEERREEDVRCRRDGAAGAKEVVEGVRRIEGDEVGVELSERDEEDESPRRRVVAD